MVLVLLVRWFEKPKFFKAIMGLKLDGLFCLTGAVNVPEQAIMNGHKGRPQKRTFSGPLSKCGLIPLQTSASRIIHHSMIWQCNCWCSQNILLIGVVQHWSTMSSTDMAGLSCKYSLVIICMFCYNVGSIPPTFTLPHSHVSVISKCRHACL